MPAVVASARQIGVDQVRVIVCPTGDDKGECRCADSALAHVSTLYVRVSTRDDEGNEIKDSRTFEEWAEAQAREAVLACEANMAPVVPEEVDLPELKGMTREGKRDGRHTRPREL